MHPLSEYALKKVATFPAGLAVEDSAGSAFIEKQVQVHGDLALDSDAFAAALDKSDEMASLAEEFYLPTREADGGRVVYMVGNSLGLQPKNVARLIEEELTVWREGAIEGHLTHPYGRPWVSVDEECCRLLAPLVGANEGEVAVMGSLSSNLHLLLAAFYHPIPGGRRKILIEGKAFPSDHFIVESQLRMHGLDPADAMVIIEPSAESLLLTTTQIVGRIKAEGSQLAVVLLPMVQYYTGQVFDIEAIAAAAHSVGAYICVDAAHGVGNIPMSLHDWGVDFAAWCSYKYLNAGPGAIAGLFVHERHDENEQVTVLCGWWGHCAATRFQMNNKYERIKGARGFQLSNPDVLSMTSLLGSLQVFAKTTMADIRKKSCCLTAYARALLAALNAGKGKESIFSIVTPISGHECGAQLSIVVSGVDSGDLVAVEDRCREAGLAIDIRHPGIIRMAPTALYSSYMDVLQACRILSRIFQDYHHLAAASKRSAQL